MELWFTEPHTENVRFSMKVDRQIYSGKSKFQRIGIMVNQHESPFYQETAYAMQRAHKRIVSSFPLARVYQVHIPTYPSGHWLFGFASKKYHPVKGVDWERWEKLGIRTRYYNTKLHAASFALPTYVEEILKSEEPEEE